MIVKIIYRIVLLLTLIISVPLAGNISESHSMGCPAGGVVSNSTEPMRTVIHHACRAIHATGKGIYTFGRIVECVTLSTVAFSFIRDALISNVSLQNRCGNSFEAFVRASVALALFRSLKNGDRKVTDKAMVDSKSSSNVNTIAHKKTLRQKIRQWVSSLDARKCMQLAYMVGRGAGVVGLLGHLRSNVIKNAITKSIGYVPDVIQFMKYYDEEMADVMEECFADKKLLDKVLYIGMSIAVCNTVSSLITLYRNLKNGDNGFEGTAVSELFSVDREKEVSQGKVKKRMSKKKQDRVCTESGSA